MPDDRLIHPRCGKSEKVSLLTDLEFRVWIQYVLSADDFGVMRMAASTLKADNYHLENRSAKQLLSCLVALVTRGLVRVFQHQGQSFLFQHDWQDFQKVEYPRATDNPKPSEEALAECTQATRELFAKHPGGTRKKKEFRERPEGVPNVSREHPEDVSTTRAGAPAKRLTANGQRLTAHGSEGGPGETARPSPIVKPRRKDAAFEGARLYVPQRAHQDLLALANHGGGEQALIDWYAAVDDDYAAHPDWRVDPDLIAFWKARYRENWPPPDTERTPKKPWAPLRVS